MLLGLTVLALASVAGAAATGAGALLVLRGVEGLGFLLVVLPAPSMARAPRVDSPWPKMRAGLSCFLILNSNLVSCGQARTAYVCACRPLMGMDEWNYCEVPLLYFS
ncbi:MAG: hypothetical protein ACK40A_17430, partial [Pannonibacter indicus]